jgi:hypothetical protein
MVRRLVAAGVGVVLLIVIVLLVNGCLNSQRTQALKDYNHNVSQLARAYDEQVAHPLFTTLTGAAGKSALSVDVQVDQLRMQAQSLANRVKNLSVPGEMAGAQRNLLLLFDLRAEAMTKLTSLVSTALGGHAKQASPQIAGAMENFLASDVIYSQRVAPLIQQMLSSKGIHGLSTSSTVSLPNIGWLEPATVLSRLTGRPVSATQNGQVAPGTHGSGLVGVSVGGTALEPEPTLNHIGGGGNPTFTVSVEDTGSNSETNVKTDVTVTAGGKQFKASRAIETTEPGKTAKVEVPITGVPLGVASKIEAYVEPVPGETSVENNKATFLAIFGQ